MNSVHAESVGSSAMSDLDGYSIPGEYTYHLQSNYNDGSEEFGFDPPQNSLYPKSESFSPPTIADSLQLSGWSGFEEAECKDALVSNQLSAQSENTMQNFEITKILSQKLPGSARTLQRFGQVTPPRSNSASSEETIKTAEVVSPKLTTVERRKRSSKSSIKDEPESTQPTTIGRKRKNARRTSTAKEEQDDKRRQSLEKNRLAAAKCRVNKKEKTEQLQRNSHEKAVHNAFLKEQVMRMKEEVQQMNALLLAHANCEGCKSPEEIQKHLSNLGNEFFAHHMSSMGYDYSQVNLDEMQRLDHDAAMHSDYFSTPDGNPAMLNPPLPDFDRSGEFEVHTPMQTD